MADVLSVLASVTGVLAFTAKLTKDVLSMISEIRDAPDDIADLRLEIQHLPPLIQSIETLTLTYGLPPEGVPLQTNLKDCLDRCRAVLAAIKIQLRQFVSRASGKRNPIRMISWAMRKGEIRNLRDRLRDSKTMLQTSVLVYNSYLTGKGPQEITDQVNRGFENVKGQLRDIETFLRFKRRLQDDLESVSASGGRRASISNATDAGLPLRMFLEDNESALTETSPLPAPQNGLDSVAPLLQAAQAGNSQQVHALISMGASPSLASQDGRTALHFCAIYDDVVTAEMLVDHGADMDAMDNKSRSPLRTAINTGSFDIATFLVRKGGSLEKLPSFLDIIRQGQGVTGLDAFLQAMHERLGNQDKAALLHEVLERHDDSGLRLLLDAGLDVHARDSSGISLIHHAILRGRKSALTTLLSHGADPNDYLPPETRNGLREDVDWHRPISNMLGNGIATLVTAACVMCSPDMVRILLEGGADPNLEYPRPDRARALRYMCADAFLESAKLMIDFGADVNRLEADGSSPVYWAVYCRNAALVRYMCERGRADLNVKFEVHESPGWTPLHLAVAHRYGDVVRVLVKWGTDLDIRDGRGRTPVDILEVYENPEVRDILQRKISGEQELEEEESGEESG